MAVRDRLIQQDRRFGSLLISSTQGHSGKTVITIGLCHLFGKKGFSIQPFKKGPDYIDPSWLTVATGRSCRNLDLFLIPKQRLVQSFYQASKGVDLVVIEGAMGLYDGLDSTGYGTSADIAKLLNVPILLVVNTTRMTDSVAAMVRGYQHFQPEIKIAGVLLNYVSGRRHENKLRNAVGKYCKIPVVGGIPKNADLHIPERHLGLIPSRESDRAEVWVERIGKKLEPYLDVDQILNIIKCSETTSPEPVEKMIEENGPHVKIGVIYDQVFNFYYPENLEALRRWGANLVTIHSLHDRLPQVDGLYIGGGFPELFLDELEKNEGLRRDISKAIEEGLPVYAECAGLMYLCKNISWQGRTHEMVGIIPSEVKLSDKPQGHGYVIAEVAHQNPFFLRGLTLRGHEFHHSHIDFEGDLDFAYKIQRGYGVDGKRDGFNYKNLLASYMHLHALGTPEWAERFVFLAAQKKEGNSRTHLADLDGSLHHLA
jgi:cobyrinic acid a,c-diamide synthase